MARVTIEDCGIVVKNRFRLVLLAAARAKELTLGAHSTIKKKDKASVLALREIAKNLIDLDKIEDTLVQKYRRFTMDTQYKDDFRENRISNSTEGMYSSSSIDSDFNSQASVDNSLSGVLSREAQEVQENELQNGALQQYDEEEEDEEEGDEEDESGDLISQDDDVENENENDDEDGDEDDEWDKDEE